MQQAQLDDWHMTRALELAAQGQGHVEPNPMVGCVIAKGAEVIAEGCHRRFGGPHAEIDALSIAGSRATGSTLYVTLEPCCHTGKTPPCTRAIIAASVRRVVAAMRDPFPAVAGGGFAELGQAGIDVQSGVREVEARRLNAPYLKLVERGRPWIIAKWAMSLDGKIATHTGSSRWISNAASRAVAHRLRGRVDAIIVGRGTVEIDDPLLSARPPGARTALRIVLDSQARISPDSQLVRTAREIPVMIAAASDADRDRCTALRSAGCEVLPLKPATAGERLTALLDELGRRRMTNVLVEGGAEVLGACFDLRLIDEVHAFIAPKLLGGAAAPAPLAGRGVASVADALSLESPQHDNLEGDLHVHGRIRTE